MEQICEYTFKKNTESWTLIEDANLHKLYNVDMLDIIEISKIHNRTPGGIINRLIKHNYIVNRQSARGYMSYKNMYLYYSKILLYTNDVNNNFENKINDNVFINVDQNDYQNDCQNDCQNDYQNDYTITLQNDLKEIQKEISIFKNIIIELIDIII